MIRETFFDWRSWRRQSPQVGRPAHGAGSSMSCGHAALRRFVKKIIFTNEIGLL